MCARCSPRNLSADINGSGLVGQTKVETDTRPGGGWGVGVAVKRYMHRF